MEVSFKTQRTRPINPRQVELNYELAAFLESRPTPETTRFYASKLPKFCEYLLSQGVETLEDARPQHVRAFLTSLKEGHTLGGQHAYYRAIRAWARWVGQEYGFEHDPLANVTAPRMVNEPLKPATVEQVLTVLKRCDKRTFCGRRDDALIRFALDTALRASELLRLNTEDVNLDTGDVHIAPEASKTKQPRTVFVGPRTLKAVRAYLRRRKDDNPALWVTESGERLGYYGLRSILTSRSDDPPTWHGIRKLAATTMLKCGADLEIIRRILGHTSLITTQRYLCLSEEDLRQSFKHVSPAQNLLG